RDPGRRYAGDRARPGRPRLSREALRRPEARRSRQRGTPRAAPAVSPAALLVGQSGGPTAVINSTLAGVLAEATRQRAVGAVYGLRHGVEGLLAEEWLDLTHLDPRRRAGLRHTPAAALGASRHRLRDDELERALAALRRHDARYLVLIGGNDTADTTARLDEAAAAAGYALAAVAAPKTIDNDLPATEPCPGYGSAPRDPAVPRPHA